MSRILFDQAPPGYRRIRGELIRRLQEGLGFELEEMDGIFGGDTQRAIQSWQLRHELPNTGAVSEETWKQLTRTPVPSIFDRCLQLTSAFEGHGFTKLEGNYDGAGLTWGIIGFTWHNRQLQGMLRAIQQKAPTVFTESFGSLETNIIEVLRRPLQEQMAWADSISIKPGKVEVQPA